MASGKKSKKEEVKAYEKYAENFIPRPHYIYNAVKAFVTGGAVCALAMLMQNGFIMAGANQEDAGSYVTIVLIMTAQLLTGIGVFDAIGKFAGAGVIVPITGFANAMVATALEYKKEGPVLGIGSKMFTVAGPVLVCGISAAAVIGLIYRIVEVCF